jgi:fructokinase
MATRIGLDIGGTKIAAIALRDDGTVVAEAKMPTPQDYKVFLAACASLVKQMDEKAAATCSVGVGMAGYIVKKTGLAFPPNIPAAMDRPIIVDLEKALRRPIRLANDADCFVLSEAIDGAAQKHRSVYGVIMGTGVGGGFVIDRQLVTGANGFTEWGHLPLPWHGAEDGLPVKCGCGRTGCVETVINGRGLARLYQIKSGKELMGEAVVALAEQQDKVAVATLEHFYRLVAKAFTMLIVTLDPDVIVVGGGLSSLPNLASRVQQHCRELALSNIAETPIVIAQHGPTSGLRGAARLWRD